MSRILTTWEQARLDYQKRYVKFVGKYIENPKDKDVLGHLHECSYVLIHIFGLSAKQVTELEKHNFCGLSNADLETRCPEEQYE